MIEIKVNKNLRNDFCLTNAKLLPTPLPEYCILNDCYFYYPPHPPPPYRRDGGRFNRIPMYRDPAGGYGMDLHHH